ncbi:MAG: transposase, partial [Candidatus Bathyarchaeia archaeon]
QKVFTCTEAARCQPEKPLSPAHDAFTRLLKRQPPDTGALWREAQTVVNREKGFMVLDDTTLDKPYAEKMDLVTYHWSGKHHRVVKGINLITLLWTDGEALIPCDFRVYDKPMGGHAKNESFRDMLVSAGERGFKPGCVLFDSWYSSLGNLKTLRGLGWRWLTRLKANRLVNPDGSGYVPVSELAIPPEGREVHLKGYGVVRVFRSFSRDGEAEHWATGDLWMAEEERRMLSGRGWGIETYHRGIKQCCGIEGAQVRGAVAQLNHLACSIRAFIRLEVNRLRTGVSWYEAKASIVREAIRVYLINPILTLTSTA